MSLVTPKKGYKSVKWLFGKEIEIPEEWEVKSVDCLGEIVTGTTPSTIITENYGSEFLWATPSDLISTKNVVETETKLSKKGFEQVRKLPKHSIMMTCIGMIGRTGLTSEEMSTNQQINSIITKNVNFEFVYYSLTFNQERISNSANQSVVQIINKKDFGKIKIIIPKNISEQQKIATILSNVDNLIESTGKVIAHSKKVKNGLMQKLLTQGIGHTKFKTVPWMFGKEIEIPEEWELEQLEKFSNIMMGMSPPSESYNENQDGLPFYQGVTDFGENYPNTTMWCSDPRKIADKNQILFSVRAPVGETNITNEQSCLGRGVCSINPLENKLMYCYFLISYFKKQFVVYAQGTTYDAINRNEIARTRLPFTSNKKEQQKIASILSNIDSKIASQEQYKEKLERLKKSLMQKLLTGEVRV